MRCHIRVGIAFSLEKGKICGEASTSYPIEYPQPAWAQQSPAAWLNALDQAAHSLVVHNNISTNQGIGLGLDVQVDSVVAVDKNGNPFYLAIIWTDRHAVSECEEIAMHPDLNCLTETGFMPDIGAMIALLQASTCRGSDLVVGKSNRMIIDAVAHKLGLQTAEMAIVGNRLSTDIALGATSGITTCLVLSGETHPEDLTTSLQQPTYCFENLGTIADWLRNHSASSYFV